MYIPDLFGAYQKGREAAIQANWKDLQNYEDIERRRNNNDLTALDILRQRAKFGGEMSTFQDNVDQSARANEVANYAQPGLVARADMGAKAAQVQRTAYLNNEQSYGQALNDIFAARLQEQTNAATTLQGKNDTLQGQVAYTLGTQQGQDAINTARANSITTAHAPYVADATARLWDDTNRLNKLGTQLGITQAQNSIANQPLIQQNTQQALANQVAQTAAYQGQQQNLAAVQAEQILQGKYAYLLELRREYEVSKSPAILAEIQRIEAELGVASIQPTATIATPTAPQTVVAVADAPATTAVTPLVPQPSDEASRLALLAKLYDFAAPTTPLISRGVGAVAKLVND